MKQWIGTLCRAFLDFLLILLVLALVEAGDWYGAGQSGGFLDIALGFGTRSLALVPLALAAAMMFAIFSFEKRVQSRPAAWLGTLLFGLLVLLPFTAIVSRLPRLPSGIAAAGPPAPPMARQILEGGESRMVFSELDGVEVSDLVSVSFSEVWPRVRYAGQALYDPGAGILTTGTSTLSLLEKRQPPPGLIPDAASFGGVWIWDRLGKAEPRSPGDGRGTGFRELAELMALCAGFVLFVAGSRFAARATRWPLANAFLSGPILIGLLVADAYLAGPAAISLLRGFAFLSPVYLLAAIEAFLGVLLAVLDLLLRPKDRWSAFDA